MKKYIIQALKDRIEDKNIEWATNYCAQKYQETLGTSDSKKQVESAIHNMKTIEVTLTWLKKQLKEESK